MKNRKYRKNKAVAARAIFCAGDAIFSNFVASPPRDENHKCSHPLTGDVTAEKIARKKSPEWKLSRQNLLLV